MQIAESRILLRAIPRTFSFLYDLDNTYEITFKPVLRSNFYRKNCNCKGKLFKCGDIIRWCERVDRIHTHITIISDGTCNDNWCLFF